MLYDAFSRAAEIDCLSDKKDQLTTFVVELIAITFIHENE